MQISAIFCNHRQKFVKGFNWCNINFVLIFLGGDDRNICIKIGFPSLLVSSWANYITSLRFDLLIYEMMTRIPLVFTAIKSLLLFIFPSDETVGEGRDQFHQSVFNYWSTLIIFFIARKLPLVLSNSCKWLPIFFEMLPTLKNKVKSLSSWLRALSAL